MAKSKSGAEATERKRAKKSVESDLLRILLNNLPDLVYIKDTESRFVFANQTVARHMGTGSPEELIGKTDFDYFPKDLAQKYFSDEQKIVRSGKPLIGYEESSVTSEGKKNWFLSTKVPIKDGQGKTAWVIGMNRDITKHKRAEVELIKSREEQNRFSERLAGILAAINELSKEKSLDNLCRHAVEMLKEHIGLDRAGIWFFDEDHKTMIGSFGTDASGRLQDERGNRLLIDSESVRKILQSKEPVLIVDREALRNEKGEQVGWGHHVAAGLWDGEKEIGFIGADNLIRKIPIVQQDRELLSLFAVSLGHLCTVKRAEERIRADVREKQILLQETHHRVQDNMQVIVSLLRLQSTGIQDPMVRQKLLENVDRIRSMVLVHEMLHGSDQSDRINFQQYLQNLATHTWKSLQTEVPSSAFHLHADAVDLRIDEAVPCGLVVNELLTNTLKHAFPKGWEGKPRIWIDLKRVGDEITLVFGDNGAGLPGTIDLQKPESLGMKLIAILPEQLQGTIGVDRNRGTAFTLRFRCH